MLGYCCRIWEFADLFPAAAREWPWLPRFEHLLFDQTQVRPAQAAGSTRARLLQLTMMHAFEHAVPEARERMKPLLDDLEQEGSVGHDDMRMFVRYILEDMIVLVRIERE